MVVLTINPLSVFVFKLTNELKNKLQLLLLSFREGRSQSIETFDGDFFPRFDLIFDPRKRLFYQLVEKSGDSVNQRTSSHQLRGKSGVNRVFSEKVLFLPNSLIHSHLSINISLRPSLNTNVPVFQFNHLIQ